ncbi:MAG: phytoene desaturase family protein [Gemmatimonadales bacterium]|jgi:phytoene dehydrogenase-like protein
MTSVDAVIVGSGPNGLSAAVALARAGLSVRVYEAAPSIGGGARTEELTLPGFLHDVCSAVHPLAISSEFLSQLPLSSHGLEWIEPPLALAHPFDRESPALLEQSLDATANGLGEDARSYRRLMEPFVSHWDALAADALAPVRIPSHPLLMARFGVVGLQSFTSVARRFSTTAARGLLAGVAAHSIQPLSHLGTASAAILLGAAAHHAGWPIARRGSASITTALASYLTSLGGEIETGTEIKSLADLPTARATLLDVTPRQLLRICGDRLSARYRSQLERFRYGPGVFKADWALAAPVPWASPECARAGTVHLGGTFEEIAASEAAVGRGDHPEQPFVLIAQPSMFDSTRAPDGQHTLWGYCHVPSGSTVDMLPRIEAQIERFAPGFRERVLARHTMNSAQLEARNANLVGGDIAAGANTLRQLLFRPVMKWNPYSTSLRGVYLCSASTPPGGGVHGLCGYHAARSALLQLTRRPTLAEA